MGRKPTFEILQYIIHYTKFPSYIIQIRTFDLTVFFCVIVYLCSSLALHMSQFHLYVNQFTRNFVTYNTLYQILIIYYSNTDILFDFILLTYSLLIYQFGTPHIPVPSLYKPNHEEKACIEIVFHI